MLKLYFIALPLFFIVDILWVGVLAKNFYARQIGFILKPDINWLAAILFYIVFVFGLVVFVISPSVEKNSFIYALSLGALFGFVSYATYDLTNLATVKDWPVLMTVVDLVWGAFIGSFVSVLTYLVAVKLL